MILNWRIPFSVPITRPPVECTWQVTFAALLGQFGCILHTLIMAD